MDSALYFINTELLHCIATKFRKLVFSNGKFSKIVKSHNLVTEILRGFVHAAMAQFNNFSVYVMFFLHSVLFFNQKY